MFLKPSALKRTILNPPDNLKQIRIPLTTEYTSCSLRHGHLDIVPSCLALQNIPVAASTPSKTFAEAPPAAPVSTVPSATTVAARTPVSDAEGPSEAVPAPEVECPAETAKYRVILQLRRISHKPAFSEDNAEVDARAAPSTGAQAAVPASIIASTRSSQADASSKKSKTSVQNISSITNFWNERLRLVCFGPPQMQLKSTLHKVKLTAWHVDTLSVRYPTVIFATSGPRTDHHHNAGPLYAHRRSVPEMDRINAENNPLRSDHLQHPF